MRRGVREKLKVVWRVFVVRRYKNVHDLVQEFLGGCVIGEQGISIYKVKVTLIWVREALSQPLHLFGGLQT